VKQPNWEDLPEILTAEDMRAYLRYESLDSIYDLLKSGQIKAIGYKDGKKVNRHWRATKKAFGEFVFGKAEG